MPRTQLGGIDLARQQPQCDLKASRGRAGSYAPAQPLRRPQVDVANRRGVPLRPALHGRSSLVRTCARVEGVGTAAASFREEAPIVTRISGEWARPCPSAPAAPSRNGSPALLSHDPHGLCARANRVSQVFAQAVETETVESPASGSVVPWWSQHSMQSVSVSRSMWIVNVRSSFSAGGRTDGDDSTGTPV